MKTLPLAEAKAKLSRLIHQVMATDEQILITRNGRPVAVVVSPDEYEGWKETQAIRSYGITRVPPPEVLAGECAGALAQQDSVALESPEGNRGQRVRSQEEKAMTDALVPCPTGQYRFLPGIDPYSCGVVAEAGHEIVHATLQAPVPYREGFALIDRHLRERGRPRAALCAIELRIPAPFSFGGFAEFNEGYRAILIDWGLLVDGLNPIARTNVAPVVAPPAVASLYAFSYTVLGPAAATPTFVVAGSGELRPGPMGAEGVVRRGDTSPEALAEKADTVMVEQQRRLGALGARWADVTCVDIYTAHPIHSFLASRVLALMGSAAVHGVHWYLSRPPIADLDYEMDMRGVREKIRLDR